MASGSADSRGDCPRCGGISEVVSGRRPTKRIFRLGRPQTARFLLPGLTCQMTYANIGMYSCMKKLTWLAKSRSNVRSFPAGVQEDIGYALYAAQLRALADVLSAA